MNIPYKKILNFIITNGLLAIIATLLSTLIVNYLNNKWKRKQDKELLTIKKRTDAESKKLDVLYQSVSTALSNLHGKQVDAVKSLWESVLALRELCGTASYFFTLLVESEYNDFSNENTRAILGSLPDANDHVKKLDSILRNIEKSRMFFSDDLYKYFWVYGVFSGRLVAKLTMDCGQRAINAWYNDKNMLEFLKVFFSDDQIMTMNIKHPMGLKTAMNAMEIKILVECRKMALVQFGGISLKF